jgi:hypothetical protein
LHHFVFYIGVYFPPRAPHPRGSAFMLLDGHTLPFWMYFVQQFIDSLVVMSRS